MNWTTDEDGVKWISDENGNRCSVRYFGSEEAAEKALKSLEDCKNCVNCSACSGCSDCSVCSGCSDCSVCSGCSGCSGCSACSRCSDCSRCSRCSRCSACSGCSGCSNIAYLNFKENVQAEPQPEGQERKLGPPPIPKIENIHQKLLAAVTADGNKLKMDDVHVCQTTHCRAGWVVHLAGKEGYALEAFHNWELAAHLIYKESSPHKVLCARFYDGNKAAMDDIKRMAELEANTPAAP